jgi:hypothetical protein
MILTGKVLHRGCHTYKEIFMRCLLELSIHAYIFLEVSLSLYWVKSKHSPPLVVGSQGRNLPLGVMCLPLYHLSSLLCVSTLAELTAIVTHLYSENAEVILLKNTSQIAFSHKMR